MEDDIEEIIEQKVEKRMKEERRKLREQIKKELEQETSSQDSTDKEEISRRNFLKKLGAGAIGLGALSLAPAASKVTITDSSVKKDGTDFWFSGLSSNYDVSGQNLTDSGTTIWDTSNSEVPSSSIGAHASRHSQGNADAVTVENLAASSTDTGKFFQPDGSGGVQAAAAPSGNSTEIETQSPSGVSEVTFTSGIDSDHSRYILELSDVVPANDGVRLDLQVSTDGGSTWKTGSSDYDWTGHTVLDNGDSKVNSTGDSKITLTRGEGNSGVGSDSGQGLMATVELSDPANGSQHQLVHSTATYVRQKNDAIVMLEIAGRYLTAEAIDGIRLQFSSGNWESGTAELRGLH